MSHTATLVYHATATGPVSPTALEVAMAGVNIDFTGIEEATGAIETSDVTTLLGSVATRTFIFNINTAAFLAALPAGQEASPFIGLYLAALSTGLATKVVEDPVVIA